MELRKAMSSRGQETCRMKRAGRFSKTWVEVDVQGVGRFGTEERPSCYFRGFSLFASVAGDENGKEANLAVSHQRHRQNQRGRPSEWPPCSQV